MQLHVKGKNLEVNESIRSYAERKLQKLDRQLARVDARSRSSSRSSRTRRSPSAGRRGDRPPQGPDAARARGRARHAGRDRRARRQARPPGQGPRTTSASTARKHVDVPPLEESGREPASRRRSPRASGLFRRRTRRSTSSSLREAGLDRGSRSEPRPAPAAARAPASTASRPRAVGTRRSRRGRRRGTRRHGHGAELAGDDRVRRRSPTATLLVERGGRRRGPRAARRGGRAGAAARRTARRPSGSDGDLWAVRRGGSRCVELPDAPDGDELEPDTTATARSSASTASRRSARVPELERLGEREGPSFCVRGGAARRRPLGGQGGGLLGRYP